MLHQMIQNFKSAFIFSPGHSSTLILLAITFGIVLGGIWLALFWPPMFKKPWLWVVIIVSAIFTWTARAFVQTPLMIWSQEVGNNLWDPAKLNYIDLILLVGIPQMLFVGIVQEAAKFVPVLFYWWGSKRSLTPKFGLMLGAVSGAGFGILETINKINMNSVYRWNWLPQGVGQSGILSSVTSIIFHTASTALLGYGLTKRKAWLYFMIVVLAHGFGDYVSIILQRNNRLTTIQVDLLIGILLLAITIVVLWLRWHKTKEITTFGTQSVVPGINQQPPVG
jgi:RsiW-degrading membrane proteinase PrsW (M82 family)